MRMRNLVESLEKKYSIDKEEKRPLHESFVEEWWGQTDEDPFEFAYEYGLTCKKIGHNNDEDLYRFSGEKEDFDKARKDGYFYSLDFDSDEGHSEDLNEALDKWVKLNKIVRYRDVADNFECDQHGNVRNAKTGRQLKPATNHGGYSDLKYTVKTKEGKGKSVAKEQLIKEIEDSFIFSKLGEKDESLNESVAGDIIWEKVRDVIREKIETEIIDNLAMVIQTEVPEYNPDWCAESSNQSQWAADKLAEELATELMFELE